MIAQAPIPVQRRPNKASRIVAGRLRVAAREQIGKTRSRSSETRRRKKSRRTAARSS